nr:DUF2306 domain-containing protein [uncultured Rhodoferax sp.]
MRSDTAMAIAPGRYSAAQWTGWSTLMLLALGVSGYTLWLLLGSARPDFAAALFARHPVGALVHMVTSPLALVAGALQVNRAIRTRHLVLHRWLGRLYVLAVLLAGSSGLALAFGSFGGPITHWGFGLMAVLWLGSTGLGFMAMRRGKRTLHREWMMRSYAITLAAVTLRIYVPLTQIAGLPFEDAYRAIAWLCWVPNLLLAEWLIRRLRRTARP